MKIKSLKILGMSIMLSLVMSLGVIFMPGKEVQANATTPVYNYMLVGGKPEKTEIYTSAGSMYINNQLADDSDEYKYVIGEKNIEIKANANNGFVLKGWYILYESTAGFIDGTDEGYIGISADDNSINSGLLNVCKYSVENKQATLVITEMFDDIKIAPVYDYEYYTVTMQDADQTKTIGSFKYGDNVTISESVSASTVIDATGVQLSNSDVVYSCNFTKDATTGKTIAYTVEFNVNVYEDITVILSYDRLYKVDLKFYLGADELSDVTSQEFQDITAGLTTKSDEVYDASQGKYVARERYFKKLDTTSFLIKAGENFEVSFASNIKNSSGYVLYNLASIDGVTSTTLANFNRINGNQEVEIVYTYKTYKLQFVGVDLLLDNSVQVNADLELPESVELTIKNRTFNLNNKIDNVGYEFKGYAKYDASKTIYSAGDLSITSVELDYNAPQDMVVYLAYSKINYTINLTGLTNTTLEDTSGNTVYPVVSATMNGETKSGTTISFAGFVINNELNLTLTLNKGFVIKNVEGMTKSTTDDSFSLVLDKTYLTGKSSAINLAVEIDTEKYSLTYRISKLVDADSGADYAMATISIEGVATSLTINGDYYEIVVNDLEYYSTKTLKSVAQQTSAGEFYKFSWFTTDFKTVLSGASKTGAEEYSINYTIYEDSVVYVVYTQPKTQLQIVIKSAPVGSGITFEVSQEETTGLISPDASQLYELNQNKLVTINISGLTGNAALFGYKFDNLTLYTRNPDTLENVIVVGSESTSSDVYTFTPSSSEVYVLVVKIDAIQYKFNITSNLGYEETRYLTIENSIIKFTKPSGYFVGKVQIQLNNSVTTTYEDYVSMRQSNDSRNGQVVDGVDLFTTYLYKISTDRAGASVSEFEQIISKYGIVNGSDIDVNIFMTFNIYTYQISVKYYKFYNNTNDTTAGKKLTYPQIELTYRLPDGTTDSIEKTNISSGIKFEDIPYGATITLNVVKSASIGFEMKGWYDDACLNRVSTDDELINFTLTSMTKDKAISYRVDYKLYDIDLNFEEAKGSANINGTTSITTKMGDYFRIESSSDISKGFIPDSIKYKKAIYTEYEFVSDEQFEADYLNLFTKSGDYIFPVTSQVYDATVTYYSLSYEEIRETATTYTEASFDVGNYYVESDGSISFEITFISVELKIENISTMVDALGGSIDALDLNKIGLLSGGQYDKFESAQVVASYSVQAYKTGVYRNVGVNDFVTVDDIIIIDIQISKNATTISGKTYDLSKGLELDVYTLTSTWNNLTCTNNGNGAYQIIFAVNENVNSTIASQGKILLTYGYQQKELRKVTVTSNLASYDNFYQNSTLSINIGETTTRSTNSGTISMQGGFLSGATLSLDFGDSIKDCFVINSITAYKASVASANIIDNLSDYGIVAKTAVKNNRVVISSVEAMLMYEDIVIQFNVQPRLYLEGNEITTQHEYLFKRVYTIDQDGNGVAQKFSLGSAISNDIAGYEISDTTMKVDVYKNGVYQSEAVNVGEYVLKLSLKTSSIDSWLNYITELPITIKLKISPLPVSLTAQVKSKIVEEYFAKSDYNLNLTKVNVAGTDVLQTPNGEIEITGCYEEGGNIKQFKLGVLNFDSKYKAEIVLTGDDGFVSNKNVTSGYAHILLTGLNLVSNDNFYLNFDHYVLNSEEVEGLLIEACIQIAPKVVDILYLDVYDKVWNGDSNAKFGLMAGQSKYVVEFTYLEDDVYLNADELKVYFASRQYTGSENIELIKNADIGENKFIVVDARTALSGNQKNNYIIGTNGILNYRDAKTIYPYTISTVIKGVGNVTITNKRGLEDYTKANLIPVNSVLSVERFEAESAEYKDVYSALSSYISRRSVFAAGYNIKLIDKNGSKTSLSNELYLTIPAETDLKNVVLLSGDRVLNVSYDERGGNIEIDLKQMDGELTCVALIQNRALFKAWQIILIVVSGLGVGAGIGVAVFFIVRKRKLKNAKYDTI